METYFKTIIEQMNVADLATIMAVIGTLLGFWFKFGGIISKLRTKSDQQENELKQLRADLEKHKEYNDLKIEKLSDKIEHVGSAIGDKLSSIDRDLIETSVFLKNNVNFLSSISRDNKGRIDDHDKRFIEYDRNLNEFYKYIKSEDK